jgi:hypothetical protein
MNGDAQAVQLDRAESLQLVRTGKPLSEQTFPLHIQQQTCGPNPYCLLQIAHTT